MTPMGQKWLKEWERQIEERNATATVQNMPKQGWRADRDQREHWPKIWLQEWERKADLEDEAADQKRQFNARPTAQQLKQSLRLLGLCLRAPEFRTLEQLSKDFKHQCKLYSIDKMGREGSQELDPPNVDCSTQELRQQAWTRRIQNIVEARDFIVSGFKFGAKPDMAIRNADL